MFFSSYMLGSINVKNKILSMKGDHTKFSELILFSNLDFCISKDTCLLKKGIDGYDQF